MWNISHTILLYREKCRGSRGHRKTKLSYISCTQWPCHEFDIEGTSLPPWKRQMLQHTSGTLFISHDEATCTNIH